jgi:multidrug efflux pump subunit AcrA (membrane-fusion protein)
MKIFSIPVIIAAAIAMLGCQRAASQKTSDAPPVPVEVAAAEVRTMPIEMLAIGTVEPLASVQLKSKVQGEILRVHFADGAEVRAGDALFDIDARPFEAALKRAQANLAMARSTAANASEQADRYTTLIKRGVASKEQFSQYLSTAETQKSVLDARQADVDEAQLSLDWAKVRAPISGRAGSALLKAGNIVNANTDVLTVINQVQPIYVAFSLHEGALADVRQWMARSKPVVTVRDPDSGRLLGTGELSKRRQKPLAGAVRGCDGQARGGTECPCRPNDRDHGRPAGPAGVCCFQQYSHPPQGAGESNGGRSEHREGRAECRRTRHYQWPTSRLPGWEGRHKRARETRGR